MTPEEKDPKIATTVVFVLMLLSGACGGVGSVIVSFSSEQVSEPWLIENLRDGQNRHEKRFSTIEGRLQKLEAPHAEPLSDRQGF